METLACSITIRLFSAFVDIDGLKETNDTEGQEAGDRLIVQVAGAVRSMLRAYDVVIRYGGDEFVCGMWGLTESEASRCFGLLNQGADDLSASISLTQLTP